MQKMNVELLAPAGSYESMTAAFLAGADAVYMGGNRFGARAYADNPDAGGIMRAIEYAHQRGKKLYLTVNTLLKDGELEELYGFLNPFYRQGLDAVIVQDFGVLSYVRDMFPKMDIHASTQMGITGAPGAAFLKECGASRVVTARELSLEEIRKIHEQVPIEIECFVHGALCFCYSGQCLFSSMIGGRSGNRGRCAQPCRLPYRILELGERQAPGSYLLSPKDLCTLELLPRILDAGVFSLKIEGRMKNPEYAAGVTRIYRNCLDRILDGNGAYAHTAEEEKELLDLYNRGGFTKGYFIQHNGPRMMSFARPNHSGTRAARITGEENGMTVLQALEPIHAGDVLEYRGEDLEEQKKRGRNTEKQKDRGMYAEKQDHRGKQEKDAPEYCGGHAEVVMKEDVPPMQTFRLPRTIPCIKGAQVWRTRDQALLAKLRETYLLAEDPVKINGKLRLSASKTAILEVSCKNVSAEVTGPVPQKAENRPLQESDVRKQMEKTGGSGFCFENLDIEMEDGLFLPLGELNRMRRDGIEALRQCMQKEQERPDGAWRAPRRSDDGRCSSAPARLVPTLSASFEDMACFSELCAVPEIDTLYVDCTAFSGREDFIGRSAALADESRRCGKRCMYILPWIFREKALGYYDGRDALDALETYDGLLLRDPGEYQFLKTAGYGGTLAADWNLYTFNGEAHRFWMEAGLSYDTISPELNRQEISRRGCRDSELIVYGYQPLMVSAQCQVKNTMGCTRTPGTWHLEDRKKKCFAVRNHCAFCYNTIYNSAPLELIDRAGEIGGLSPRGVRLQFTIEPAQDVRKIAERYAAAFARTENSAKYRDAKTTADRAKWFTRGHYTRGVE